MAYAPDPAYKAALDAAKNDESLILQVLGIKKADSHAKCPFCQKPNMQVKKGKSGWHWKCFSGCGGERGGSVIDAISLLEKKTSSQVCNEIAARAGVKTGGQAKPYQPKEYTNGHKPEEKKEDDDETPPLWPVLDMERAEAFVKMAHALLLDNEGAKDIYMTKKRGISLAVVEKYRLGFLEGHTIPMLGYDGKPDWKLTVPAGWVLPVTDEKGVLRGVKLHFEERPYRFDGSQYQSKSMWVMFGTEPKHDRVKNIKPLHCCLTFWPHPATLHPRKVSANFTDDPMYWIKKIPPDSKLQRRWDTTLEEIKLTYGLQISKSPTDFDGSDLDRCFMDTFTLMRGEIQKEALKNGSGDEGMFPDEFSEYVFITPGELKALAIESAGFMATSYTGGESSMPPLFLMRYFRRRRVCLFPDNDKPQLKDNRLLRAGYRGALNMEQMLYKARDKGYPIPEIRVIKGPRK